MIAPPFFVVGSARSGTTLLRVILNSHPDVAVPPESRFISELWPGRDEIDVEEFLHRLAEHPQFRNWNLDVDLVRAEIGDSARLPYADAVAAAYRAYAGSRGKTVWGDKTPRYIESIGLIARLFPEARFVHLVRDGRNVTLSYASMPFGPRTVPKAAALWAKRVLAGVHDGRRLGAKRYLEIRYEDLVEDLGTQVKGLCGFLGIPFDDGMMDYSTRAGDFVLSKAARYNPHVLEEPQAGVRSWEDEMPDDQVEMFEAVAGDVLDLFGYPRRFPSPGLAAKVTATLGRAGLPVARLK